MAELDLAVRMGFSRYLLMYGYVLPGWLHEKGRLPYLTMHAAGVVVLKRRRAMGRPLNIDTRPAAADLGPLHLHEKLQWSTASIAATLSFSPTNLGPDMIMVRGWEAYMINPGMGILQL